MFDEADQTAPEPRKTGRDNTSTACLFWLLVSTNTEADVRMLCKRFWCWFSLDFVENLVQSVEFRCSWQISHNQHKRPVLQNGCQESQQPKIYIIGRETQQLAILSEESFPGRGEAASTIIVRETEQIKNEKKLPDKCKWGQISAHYRTM